MIVPLAISVSLLGGVATWLSLTTSAFLIWGAFIAWACFYHLGGDANAFKGTIISTFFGVIVAWAAGLTVVSVQGPPVVAAIIVAISIAAYILAAHFKPLSSIPAVTYGYAATFAYLTQNADAFKSAVMLSVTMRNAIFLVPFSLFIGACFAFASAILASRLQKNLRTSTLVSGT